ncbi:MAG: hypothetical protein HXY45_04920 [Syntrophaceae bacterium]|jgi:hypothetical protein|nr:hypothetical protein [Syntrophaceae bacterium]
MKGSITWKSPAYWTLGGLVVVLLVTGFFWWREPTRAFGGNFAPMAQQQFARFQIASRDATSAWVIDTAAGDVFLIFSTGKWKEVGSIFDEKNRIKK